MLRPASWLALLSRTFTLELSLAGSPRANVEYDYVGKQSIPTAGLSPASPTALWAAIPDLTPGTNARKRWRAKRPRAPESRTSRSTPTRSRTSPPKEDDTAGTLRTKD